MVECLEKLASYLHANYTYMLDQINTLFDPFYVCGLGNT